MPKLVKRCFILLFTACLSFSPSGEASTLLAPKANGTVQNQWKNFSFEESGFSVDLPAAPEHIQQSITIPSTNISLQYDTFVSEPNSSIVYVISVWKYPGDIDMSSSQINLQDGFKGMLSALPNSKVEKMQMTKEQGFNALEFLVKSENIYFQGKLILVYNTLYQVFTVYKASEDMSKNYPRFINSFKLLNPAKHKVENAPLRNANDKKLRV